MPSLVAFTASVNASWKSANSLRCPRYSTSFERSGSYRSSSVAWVSASDLPFAIGWSGIAVHLDRPERVRLHQHRDRARRERKRRRKIHRLAQDQILRRLHVRKDRLVRLLGASGQPGQRQRSSHHLQEAAPAHRIHPLACLPRKLPLQHLVKSRRLRQLVQVLPEALAVLALELRAHLSQRQLSPAQSPSPAPRSLFPRAPVPCSLPVVVFIGGMSRSSSARSVGGCGTAPSDTCPGPSGW